MFPLYDKISFIVLLPMKSKFQTTLPFIFTGLKKTDYQIINEQKN